MAFIYLNPCLFLQFLGTIWTCEFTCMTQPLWVTRPNILMNKVCIRKGEGPEIFHWVSLHIPKEVSSRQLVLVLSAYGSRYTISSFSKKLKENHSVSLGRKENVRFLLMFFLGEREATMPKKLRGNQVTSREKRSYPLVFQSLASSFSFLRMFIGK